MRHSLSFLQILTYFRRIIISLNEGVERSTALNGVMGNTASFGWKSVVSKLPESLTIFFSQ